MKPLSAYIHIPFCKSKCAYCDFVSFAMSHVPEIKVDDYINALTAEIERFKKALPAKHSPLSTIYIGGGTPTLLSGAQMAKIFRALRAAFQIAPDAEITVESNPGSVTLQKLRAFRRLGVNRISIGVQSFDDTVLKTLGRAHTAKQAMRAIQTARDAGFTNISIDLIHSVPEKTGQNKNAVNTANAANYCGIEHVNHVSAYSLIIEPGTRMAALVARGELIPKTESESLAEQRAIEKILKSKGFKKYEVSNFAKNGLTCRHNLAYWSPHTHEYIGFGLAAHSLFCNKRFENTKEPGKYLSENERSKAKDVDAIGGNRVNRTDRDIATELVMLGLRTVRGIAFSDLMRLGFDIKRERHREIEMLRAHRLVRVTETHIAATARGFCVLNQIIAKLAP
jgi:oxygen-independent coproporphyrinogen-3 oxidase